MRVRFFRAFTIGCATLAIAIALTTPVAQAGGWERPGAAGAAGRIVGLTLYGAGILLVLDTSVLVLLERVARNRMWISRWGWAVVGALLSSVPTIAFGMQGSSNLLESISETIQWQLSEPALLLSETLPMMLAGGVFAALLFEKSGSEDLRG